MAKRVEQQRGCDLNFENCPPHHNGHISKSQRPNDNMCKYH